MQTAWLQRANHPHCLLFFSGWGMDPEPFRFLSARSCDVLLVHDYRQLQSLDLEPLASYRQVHLAAWSMGVWVAAHLLGDRAGIFASRTALAGTLSPIDAGRGLPPEAYATMVDSFGPEVLTPSTPTCSMIPPNIAAFSPAGRAERWPHCARKWPPSAPPSWPRPGPGHLYQKNRHQPRPHLHRPQPAARLGPGHGHGPRLAAFSLPPVRRLAGSAGRLSAPPSRRHHRWDRSVRSITIPDTIATRQTVQLTIFVRQAW